MIPIIPEVVPAEHQLSPLCAWAFASFIGIALSSCQKSNDASADIWLPKRHCLRDSLLYYCYCNIRNSRRLYTICINISTDFRHFSDSSARRLHDGSSLHYTFAAIAGKQNGCPCQ